MKTTPGNSKEESKFHKRRHISKKEEKVRKKRKRMKHLNTKIFLNEKELHFAIRGSYI